MRHVFSIYGGSGSTFLANQIRRRGATCHLRPDTFFVPQIVSGRGNRKRGVSAQLQQVQSYTERPKKDAADEFRDRSGWRMDTTAPIAGQIIKYIQHIQAEENKTAMFNYLAVGRFFSEYQLRDVVFVIRHPLHNLVSVYGHQHPEKVRDMGGINAEAAVRFFAPIWCAIANEATSGCGHIVRYEYARDDFGKIPEVPSKLQGLFDLWDSSKRNRGILSKKNEWLLRKLTEREFYELYEDWRV